MFIHQKPLSKIAKELEEEKKREEERIQVIQALKYANKAAKEEIDATLPSQDDKSRSGNNKTPDVIHKEGPLDKILFKKQLVSEETSFYDSIRECSLRAQHLMTTYGDEDERWHHVETLSNLTDKNFKFQLQSQTLQVIVQLILSITLL